MTTIFFTGANEEGSSLISKAHSDCCNYIMMLLKLHGHVYVYYHNTRINYKASIRIMIMHHIKQLRSMLTGKIETFYVMNGQSELLGRVDSHALQQGQTN